MCRAQSVRDAFTLLESRESRGSRLLADVGRRRVAAERLDGLLAAIKRFDCEQARDILLSSVSGYQPNNGIDDLVWQAQHGDQGGEFTAAPQSVVTPIDSRRPTGSS